MRASRSVTQLPQLTDRPPTMFLHFDRFYSGLGVRARADAARTRRRVPRPRLARRSRRTSAWRRRSAFVDAVLDADAEAFETIAQVWNESFARRPLRRIADCSLRPVRTWSTRSAPTGSSSRRIPSYRGERAPRIETIEIRTVEEPAAFRALAASGDVDIATAAADRGLVDALESESGMQVVGLAGWGARTAAAHDQ